MAPAADRTGWTVVAADDAGIDADALVLTAPVAQSLALLDAGGVELDPAVRADLESVEYFATLALLVTLDGRPAVPEPGGVQLPETEPFTFVADNRRKGISSAEAVTLHANHAYSAARYDDDPDEVCAELLGARGAVARRRHRHRGPAEEVALRRPAAAAARSVCRHRDRSAHRWCSPATRSAAPRSRAPPAPAWPQRPRWSA